MYYIRPKKKKGNEMKGESKHQCEDEEVPKNSNLYNEQYDNDVVIHDTEDNGLVLDKEDENEWCETPETHSEEIPKLDDVVMDRDMITSVQQSKIADSDTGDDDGSDTIDCGEIDKNINEYMKGSIALVSPSGSSDDSSTGENDSTLNANQLENKLKDLIGESSKNFESVNDIIKEE